MNAYLAEHAPTKVSKDWIADMAADILEWWGDKTLSEVNGRNCRAYVEWRTAQRVTKFTKNPGRLVSDQTARHELKTLRAAINYYHKEHGPLVSVPAVTMPAKSPPRQDYFLTRSEAARRLLAAWRRPETRHVARLILIGLYSGTRPGAMLRLRWLPSPEGGWINLDGEILHRQPPRAVHTKKRQPLARIHKKLLPHLRRWQAQDLARHIPSVIHYDGQPVKKVKRSWETLRKEVGAERRDSPHILRHSSATWFMGAGIDVAEIAGYLGMTVQTLLDVYGHHHPEYQSEIAQATPRKQTNRKGTR
jgi:integrase